MSDLSLDDILLIWSYAGERPYEIVPEYFSDLMEETYLEDAIYRGTRRHHNLQVGDVLEYDYPTSWTHDLDVAKRFIEGEHNIILRYWGESIKGVYNHRNTYHEDEFIVAPHSFIVTEKFDIDNEHTMLVLE